MAKRGRPRKTEEETQWAPVKNYKYKLSTELNTLDKIKYERVIEGYKNLFMLVHHRSPAAVEMSQIHKIARKIEL